MKTTSLLLLSLLLSSCGGSGSEPQPEPPLPPALGSLREAAFPFGAAVNVNLLRSSAAYQGVVTREYRSVTAENAMKFRSLHPDAATYAWTDADYLVQYARQTNSRVHGHTLIWHNSLPAWVTGFQGDSAAWETLMKTHIQTVVGHFRGQVASWDVVNEAVAEDGTLRPSPWLQHLGPDYVARAFQYARQADPDAKLFYNDYGHEYGPTKRTAILNLVSSLKARGIPIDGIGLQLHTSLTRSDANLATAITSAAQTGLLVHISELDVAVNPGNQAGLAWSDALAAAQKAKYKLIVQTFNALPAAQRFGITTWNVTDADTWVRGACGCPDWPLPFNEQYQKKPAYDGIVEGLQ
ncbi:endo-1,4-beta-xylanase [Hymenobacter sp. 15J16-1T3B]|uniref:endo-1,4-beta-xylanase n=1 Tax=Hymenobacter sp. 15J16-1T3B TaxID=2886941 RepID=UPI001D1174B3|nr:endo-1,4-beta-xylanase [Hymenobacter sp. 15J16-1T3B]MCC3156667.1 endo-1,4-beta-xylanase [Hymenobacter sp. 15J16-1T3B]